AVLDFITLAATRALAQVIPSRTVVVFDVDPALADRLFEAVRAIAIAVNTCDGLACAGKWGEHWVSLRGVRAKVRAPYQPLQGEPLLTLLGRRQEIELTQRGQTAADGLLPGDLLAHALLHVPDDLLAVRRELGVNDQRVTPVRTFATGDELLHDLPEQPLLVRPELLPVRTVPGTVVPQVSQLLKDAFDEHVLRVLLG